jgi:hypothetical protein
VPDVVAASIQKMSKLEETAVNLKVRVRFAMGHSHFERHARSFSALRGSHASARHQHQPQEATSSVPGGLIITLE